MAGRFDRQIATALRLIALNGQEVTWRQVVDGAPGDSAEPWKPGAAVETDNLVDIVFLPNNKENAQTLHTLIGTAVAHGKVLGLMAAVAFSPKIKDIIIRDGVTYGVTSVDVLEPNGQEIMYAVSFDL